MSPLDSCSLKRSLPLLIALLVIAQIDLASAAAWPTALLSLLHLTPAPNDSVRSMSAGLGASIDLLAIYQLVRIWANRAMQPRRDAGQN